MTSVDGVGYTYEDGDNLLSDGVYTYTYDTAGRLVQCVASTRVSGTLTIAFTYNGDGHRVAKAVDGVTTTYVVAVFGLPQVLAETTGDETTRYLYRYGLLAGAGSARTWHLGDGLNSVRQLAAQSSQVKLVRGYTPFGVPLWGAWVMLRVATVIPPPSRRARERAEIERMLREIEKTPYVQ